MNETDVNNAAEGADAAATDTAAEGKPAEDKAAGQSPVRQFTIGEDDDGIRLDRWFKRHLPQIGFGMVSRWARTGQVRVDGKRVKPEDRLATGQILRVPPGAENAKRPVREKRELTAEQREQAETMLIAHTDAALVLNKPPGLATQGGTKTYNHVDGLLDAYAEGDEPRPRLVHRLDKDTSGVLLIARTPGSAAFFSKRFSGRSAKKIYWALVVGVPDVGAGMVDAPLSKQPGSRGEKMHVDEEDGQLAKTLYRVVERAGNSAAWVELQPLTGRTHQLRVHMAAIGHPIVGDGKYGGQDAFLTGSISRKMHLHARRLIIDEPRTDTKGSGKLDVTAELPEHFAASMKQLGFDMKNSNAVPLTAPPPERSPAQKKQAARLHAKQVRKERRGERRQRGGGGGSTTGRPQAGQKAGPKPKTSPKSTIGAKPAAGRKAGPSKTGPSKATPNKTGPSKARPNKTGPSKAGPNKARPKGKG